MSTEATYSAAVVVTLRTPEGLVVVNGRGCAVSQQEVHLLSALLEREGRVVARADLARRAWGLTLQSRDRRVDVCVHRLRRKLRRAAPGWDLIHTHHGFGYRFAPEPRVADPDPFEIRSKELA